MVIADKSYVTIDYKLSLESGQEVDSSPEGQPLGFITGLGQIIPGLEKALLGKSAGHEDQVTVEPEDAYGPVRDDMFQDLPRDQFPADVEIQQGMSFEAQGPHGPFMITVTKLNDNDTVTIDLNHPMAGKKLVFDIKVIDVREATADELTQATAAGCACGPEKTEDCGPGCNCG